MIIKELNIISFGKFTNKVISFDKGINLIYGENESGKSTIIAFVQFMFYGITSRKLAIAENIKLKYTPWNSEIMEGELTYSLDGTDYVIHRKCGKRNLVEVLNKNTGEKLGADITKNIGMYLFGLSEEAFTKTLFISQSGLATGPDKNGILVKRLTNLESDDTDGSSYTKVKKQIEEEIANLSSTKRSGALIPKIKNQTDELTQRLISIQQTIKSIETGKAEAENIALEIKRLNAEKDRLKSEIDICEKAKLAQDYKSAEEKHIIAKEKYDAANDEYSKLDLSGMEAFEDIDADTVSKITADNGEDINMLASSVVFAKEKANSAKTLCIVSAIGFVVCAILGFIYPIAFSAMAVFAAIAIYALVSFKTQSKKASETEEKIAGIKSEKNALLSEFGCTTASEFVKKHSEYTSLASKKASIETSIEFLKNEMLSSKSALDKILQEIITKYDKLENVLNIFSKCDNIGSIEAKKAELEDISASIHHLSTRETVIKAALSDEKSVFDEFISTKESIEYNNKLIAEYQARLDILTRALDVLNKSFSEIENNFAPKLNKNAGKILSEITNEKYHDLLINHDFQTHISSGNGYYESPYFSGGTIDQLYFAVRFGIIETIREDEKSHPVFLDDVFCQCDAKRLLGAVEFLKKYSAENQIIYTTCHEREKAAFENTGATNTIKL